MKIASLRTRRDMETAAELRAAGATWETAAVQLRRQPNLLIRWARVYREEWERLYREAEERWSRQANNESRNVLRILLRSDNQRIRLSAADKLARHWLDQKKMDMERAKETAPKSHTDQLALLAYLEGLNDADLQQFLADAVQRVHRANGGGNVQDPPRPAGAD
jgi:hypothetical protein